MAFWIRSFSYSVTPERTLLRQAGRSDASSSQALWSKPQRFRETFSVSLKRFFWPPLERFPAQSSPYRSCFGRRSSGIRTTCPAHLSCDFISMAWMPDCGVCNDPLPLGLAFHHQGSTFINAYCHTLTQFLCLWLANSHVTISFVCMVDVLSHGIDARQLRNYELSSLTKLTNLDIMIVLSYWICFKVSVFLINLFLYQVLLQDKQSCETNMVKCCDKRRNYIHSICF